MLQLDQYLFVMQEQYMIRTSNHPATAKATTIGAPYDVGFLKRIGLHVYIYTPELKKKLVFAITALIPLGHAFFGCTLYKKKWFSLRSDLDSWINSVWYTCLLGM